jgi:phospholipid-binding lipoprotein MlaA
VLDEIALDKYTFVRDAYLQRRRSLVYDGEEPPARPDDARQDDGRPATDGGKPPTPGAKPPAAGAPRGQTDGQPDSPPAR